MFTWRDAQKSASDKLPDLQAQVKVTATPPVSGDIGVCVCVCLFLSGIISNDPLL